MAEGRAEIVYTREEAKRPPFLVDLFSRLVKEKPLGVVGLVICIILLLTGVFADYLAPYGMNEINLPARLLPSNAAHWLGTDNLGRDVLSRVIYGARVSLIVGFTAATLQMFLEAFFGVISGYFGGKTDLIIQRFVDAIMAIPALFFYLTMMAVVGSGMLQVIVVLGVLRGIRGSRLARSAVIAIMENVYIDAARTVGARHSRIILRHVLPNAFAPILIQYTISLGQVIMTEATLSFLGFGIPPPIPSWGGMISGAGRQYMYDAPWMVLWPGVALALVVYGFNMLGDAVRDLLDPRLRGGLGRYDGARGKTSVV